MALECTYARALQNSLFAVKRVQINNQNYIIFVSQR